MINHGSLLFQVSFATTLYSEGFLFSTTLEKEPNSRVPEEGNM
jgi:hypothetical protein